MPSAIEIRTTYSAGELQRLAAQTGHANQSRRLLPLAAALDRMSQEEADGIGGMDRQTLRDWVLRFNAKGPEGSGTSDPKAIRRGSRPRQPADQRYESAYLFGAICPALGADPALAMPFADTEAVQAHLDEIGRTVARGAHAVLLLDRAGWHTTDKLKVLKSMMLILLPPRSPKLTLCCPPFSFAERSPWQAPPGRERLAVPARQLALEPHLRHL